MPRAANPSRPNYARIIADGRTARNMPQSLLGHLIGRDAASIKKYESGAVIPPFFVLLDIATALNLDKHKLVETAMSEIPDADQWIQDAFEDVEWTFAQTHIDVTSLHKPERFIIQHDGKEATFPKIDFLFKVSEILQFAKQQYNDIVLSKTGNLSLEILDGKITAKNINSYIVDESLYP